MPLAIKDKAACRWDQVSLGEVMLRLDPGQGRIHTTRAFQVWEGGGEYNVARGLKRCFGLGTAVVTALVDNAAAGKPSTVACLPGSKVDDKVIARASEKLAAGTSSAANRNRGKALEFSNTIKPSGLPNTSL